MLLTAEQLQEIRQIIADHHNAFAVNQFGPEAVAPEILEALKAKGLVEVELKTLEDAYVYGRILQVLGEAKAAKMTYPQFRAYVRTNPQPLTEPERHAVAVASQQAGALCQGLGNKIDKATGQMLIDADGELRRNMQATIREKTAQNIAQRETLSNLRSEIGHATGDWTRDLNRIAVTETQNAMQLGHAEAILEEHGPDARVAKRTAAQCCDPCTRLYNGPDGAPRIFKLSALQATGTNQGRKQADLRATLGPLHPNCIPAGTMITTSSGSQAVQHICPGDYVWTHKQRLRRVTHVWCQPYQGDLVEIDVGWMTLQATPNHMLFDGAQWRPASDYAVGDPIQRDTRRPHSEDVSRAATAFHDYARVLFGQGPDSPFLALVVKDDVFVHEGFMYHRDRLSDGPTVPALQGRLRFTRASALSIAGGDALTLCDPQWIDDACETLVFNRASVHVADELRRRSAPGPFASLLKDWAEPIAADPQIAGDAVQGMPLIKVQAQDQVGFDRFLATAHQTSAARTAGSLQGASYDVAAEAQEFGDGGDGHAPLVIQAGHGVGMQVETVRTPGYQARASQSTAQRQSSDAKLATYVVEGLMVVEVQTRDGVYIDLLPRGGVPGVQVTHGQDVAQTAVVSKVGRRSFNDMVYNLTVEQDESYVANTIASHNCRCQIVAVPKGAGFNDQNRMSMTGKKGILTDPLGNETERTHKSLLHKAMQTGVTQVAAMGLPVDVTQWAALSEQGRWLASGVIPHPSLQVNAIIGPDGAAGEAYVVHGTKSPDAIALGFVRPLNAALGYQGRYPEGGIDSMEAIRVDALTTYLQAEQDKVVHAHPVKMPQERLMLSLSPAIEDAPHLQPKPPQKRQNIGGIKEAWVRPQDFDQSTPVRFDKKANNIYRNTPQMPPRKLDVTTAVLPKKDVKLTIRRNKKRIADQQASNAAAADMLRVGAAHMAEFYGLGGDRTARQDVGANPLAADVLSSNDTIKRKPVT